VILANDREVRPYAITVADKSNQF